MFRLPPGSTRTDTRCTYATLCRSPGALRPRRRRQHSFQPVAAGGRRTRGLPRALGGGQPRGARAGRRDGRLHLGRTRSAEHTSELQSLMRISYAVFCLKKKKTAILTRTRNEEDELSDYTS